MKVKIREILPESVAAVVLIALSAYLLGGDVWTFWTWWLLALFMGMIAMPLTGRLFDGFEDKGWLFSKVLAIAITGFLTWFLVAVEILPFTFASCAGVSVFFFSGHIWQDFVLRHMEQRNLWITDLWKP